MRPVQVRLVVLLLVTWPGTALAIDAVDALRDAVAQHPDDQDLAWALARSLADADRSNDAIAALKALLARWSDHADAQLRLGALLSEQGRHAEAVVHLDRAVALAPDSGSAHMLYGVALDRVGRFGEADEQLILAARVEPALRAESLLLRGMALIERGDEEAGFRLLEEVIELDPLGDVAEAARLVLALRRPDTPRLRLQAYGGMDYDSNVALESGSTSGGFSSNRDDGAGVWGAMIAGDPWVSDAHRLTLGARYHERDYLDLDAFDERTLLGLASGQLTLSRRFGARVSVVGSWVMLDDESYLGQVKGRPELLVWLGERLGVAQIAADVELNLYEDDPLFSSLERDGLTLGGEVAHLFPVPGWRDGRGSWGVEYERVDTDATRDVLGFRGDYDRHHYGGHLRFDLPLPWQVAASLRVEVAGERYDNDNLVDFLVELAEDGDASPRRRKDVIVETRLGLTRPLFDHVDLELQWRFQERFSNTDVFQYERHVAGALIRVRSF